MQHNNIPGQKRALSDSIVLLFILWTFRLPFTARFFFQLFDLTGYLSHDICKSLCTDLPLPSEKNRFFLRGGGVCTQTKCAKHSHYIDYHNRYHIHSPRIQTESSSKRFFKGFSLKFCKFGGDTKVILLTSACLFILCAAMAGTKQIYATIICDLLVLLRPWCPGYKAAWNGQSEIENNLSLLLIVDCNLVSVVILLFPSMPHKFKIVDHFQRIRETYFALVQVCKFLVRQEAVFITYLLGIRFTSFLPINLEIS